jgi:hypothetical protein
MNGGSLLSCHKTAEEAIFSILKLRLIPVDAIIIDTVDIIFDTAIVAIIACAWDLSVHVNFLQLNHNFTGSSGLHILCS